jgi:hypothetical protein
MYLVQQEVLPQNGVLCMSHAVCTNMLSLTPITKLSASITKNFGRDLPNCTRVSVHFERLKVTYNKTRFRNVRAPQISSLTE